MQCPACGWSGRRYETLAIGPESEPADFDFCPRCELSQTVENEPDYDGRDGDIG